MDNSTTYIRFTSACGYVFFIVKGESIYIIKQNTLATILHHIRTPFFGEIEVSNMMVFWFII